MTGSNSIKVFVEPKVKRHDPTLYAYVDITPGIDAKAILAGEAGSLFVEQGFVLVKDCLPLLRSMQPP